MSTGIRLFIINVLLRDYFNITNSFQNFIDWTTFYYHVEHDNEGEKPPSDPATKNFDGDKNTSSFSINNDFL